MAKRYFFGLMLAIAPAVFALPEDRDQPIEITADSAVINEKQSQAEYTGAVVVTQGTLKLEGDVVRKPCVMWSQKTAATRFHRMFKPKFIGPVGQARLNLQSLLMILMRCYSRCRRWTNIALISCYKKG